VIIAVPAVRVVEMTVDQMIDVIAMGNRGVAAAGGVHVVGWMAVARVLWRALGRVGRIDGDHAFVDVVAVDHVQMPIVEVIDVAAVLDGEMPAAGAVNMVVGGVGGMRRHGKSYRIGDRSCRQFNE
jgi:hypothetical protein